jgi:hypothetical protein
MAYTQLSPSATPGGRYSFTAKSAVSHTGLFTELTVSGVPGQRRSFASKDPGVAPHTGLFTELSAMAVPGMRHLFAAKDPYTPPTPVPPEPPAPSPGGGGGGLISYPADRIARPKEKKDPWAQARAEDEELLKILMAMAPLLN